MTSIEHFLDLFIFELFNLPGMSTMKYCSQSEHKDVLRKTSFLSFLVSRLYVCL